MSVPQVNTFLHAVLLQRGHICEWVDSRASPTARYAQRAAQRFDQWHRPS